MKLRILWVMRSPVFVRNFDAVLHELAQRGHAVHVAFEGDKDGQDGRQRSLVDDLVDAFPSITAGPAPVPARSRSVYRSRLRGTVDYLRYLEPEYGDAPALRTRARSYALWGIGRVEAPLRRAPGARRALVRACGALAGVGPVPRRISRYLRDHPADVLLVSPLTHFGSPQPEYLRAARRLGQPSALALFSWDNLTNKGMMHEIPDRVIVWNEQQEREAVDHHGVRAEQVDVTGAATYDHWFHWQPSRDRERFLAELGLDPEQPCILYLCSSGFIAHDEPAWIAEWLDALRATPGPLAHVNVIVRPHPLNADGWRTDPLGPRAGVSVFPPHGEDPKRQAARQSYYDSMHHATLVVGINTTALVESAIVGRRSFTVRTARFAGTQEGTLHFHQLSERNDGPLRVADSMAEHLAQLADGLADTPDDREQLRRFVGRFVRPLGLDVDVAPIVADRIEWLARTRRPRTVTANEIAAAAAASSLRVGPAFSALTDADELRFRDEVEPGLGGADDVVAWLERKEVLRRLSDTLLRTHLAPTGTVVELGAGSCWVAAVLALRPEIERVVAVEFSRRRLEELAPVMFAALGAPAAKVERVLADFNAPGLPAGSADLVITDAAFHHASDPRRLARVAYELLRPGGTVLLFREPTLSLLRRSRDHGVEDEHGSFKHDYTVKGYLDLLRGAGFPEARAVPVAGGFRRRRQRWAARPPLAWLNGIAFAEYSYVAVR